MNADNSTPFAAFHEDIRILIGDKDHETHVAYELDRAIRAVLRLGKVPDFRIAPDGQGVEPKLTPEFNQDSYELLVKNAVLKFRKSLTKEQIFKLETEIHYLKNS